ncbi:MAG: hypothetical protein K9K67_15285 [Bacteriovoracaceae bacterium]|nr:hypothetical protein [Bacteriovoracaceae bacterium]
MKNLYSLITLFILVSSCAASEKGSLVYTGYGSISYSKKDNLAYKKAIEEGQFNAVDLLYTCYVVDEFDHNIKCDGDDSPKEKKFIALSKELKKAGHTLTLRIYVDLENQKWRALWHPKKIALAFSNLEKTLLHFSKIANEVKADSLLIGSEYEKLTQPKYLSHWKKIIKNVKENFSGKILYAANGNLNNMKEPEYRWVPFWSLLDHVGINYYPPFKGKPTKRSLSKHHKKELTKYSDFAKTIKKDLVITEVGFPLAESGIKTPYQWEYDLKEKPNSALRVLSFKSFIEKAHQLNIYEIHLWRFLPNELRFHPLGYLIDEAFMNEIALLNRK